MGLLDERSTKQQEDDLFDDLFDEMGEESPVPEPPTMGKEKASRLGRAQRSPKPAKASRPPKISKRSQKSSPGQGLTSTQKLILAFLGILVVVVYLVLLSLLRQQKPAILTTDTTTIGVSTVTATAFQPRLPTWTPSTSSAPDLQVNSPTLTPSPVPPVVTRFDGQLNLHPDDIEVRIQRGNEYLKLGVYEAALRDFEYARQLDEKRPEVHLGIGRAYYYLLDWPAAENALLTAVAFSPEMPEPHFDLGMLYYLQGRYQEAIREFDQAAEYNPDYAEAEAWLAIVSAQHGDVEEAVAAAGRAMSITQEIPVVHIAQAWAYQVQNPPNVDSAQAALLYAQKLAPYDLEVLITLARFYSDVRPERLVEAEQLAYTALQWAKNDLERARALYTLGHVYLAQNRKDEAKGVLADAADLTTYEGQVLLYGVVEDINRALAP